MSDFSMSDDTFFYLKDSDKVLQSRISELEHKDAKSFGAYLDIIQTHFRNLGKLKEQGEYSSNKMKSVTEALRQLWVVEAEKGSTFEIFKDFETFEGFLFQSEDYRGHYVHQFDVFLLGFYLLNKIMEKDSGPISNNLHVSSNPNFTWMLTATFHDMGYPIEQINNWFSRFLKMFLKVETPYQLEVRNILPPTFFEYLKYLSEEHYNLTTDQIAVSGQSYIRDWQFHNCLETKLLRKDHGVISSLLLIHSLLTQEKIKQFHTWFVSTFPYEIMPACHAISLHNFDNSEMKDLKISLSKYPYAFLLMLCDTLQDWQRSVQTQDYSELTEIQFSFPNGIPTTDFRLKINAPRKFEELDKMKNRLITHGLIKITIRQENGSRVWEL